MMVTTTTAAAMRDEQKAARIDEKRETETPRTTRTRARDRDEKNDNGGEEMSIRMEIPDEFTAFLGAMDWRRGTIHLILIRQFG